MDSLRESCQRSPEYAGEFGDDPSLDFVLVEFVPDLTLERRHPAPGDATRDDQVKAGEVGADVERQAVTGNPARDADADRADLVITHPDAGESRDSLRTNAIALSREALDVFQRVLGFMRKRTRRPFAYDEMCLNTRSVEHLQQAHTKDRSGRARDTDY